MSYTLLLADDSVTIQRVIELTFADEDVRVIAVSDGQQAVERIEADRPDIVLADIGMPKRDGYEVSAYIKENPRLAHIPVILLTGAFEPVDEARASAARCDDVLAKPFEPQMVINRVRELLGRGKKDARGGAARAAAPAKPAAAAPARPVVAAAARPVAPALAKPAAAAPARPVAAAPAPAPRAARPEAAGPAPAPRSGVAVASAPTPAIAPAPAVAVRPDPATAAPEPATAADLVVSLDDYFDRLDAALNLDAPVAAPKMDTSPSPGVAAPAPGSLENGDWTGGGDSRANLGDTSTGLDVMAVFDDEGRHAAGHASPRDATDVSSWPAPSGPRRSFEWPDTAEPPGPRAPVPVGEPELESEPEAETTAIESAPPEPLAAEAPMAEPRATFAGPPAVRPEPIEMADAFEVLLAAEQGEPVTLPAATVLAPPATFAITEELIDRIAQRVMERMSDRIVRETVLAVVSEVAERLVRDEIERIKATMK